MRIINGFENIPKREILDCRVKSLLELSRYHGLKMDSFDVMLLSRSLTFNYGHITINDSLFNDIPYATASYHNLEEVFFETLGLTYEEKKFDDTEEGMNSIKELLDSDTPMITKLDCRFLNRGGTLPVKGKINIHYLSSMLVIGYDEQDIYAVLTNSDEITEYQKFSIAEFQKFRNTQCIPYSPNGTCYYLKKVIDVDKINDSMNRLVLDGLKKLTERMLTSECENWKPFENSKCDDLSTGIKAMKMLKRDLRSFLSSLIFHKKKQYIKLSLLFLRNNLMFGSYSAFRKEFSQGLIRLGSKVENQKISSIGEEMEKVSEQWIEFLTYLSKAGRSKHILQFTFLSYLTWCKIIRKEERVYKNLHKEIERIAE